MSKSDARFEYRAKLPRTDHDLSQPFGFTCAPGMLLPIWFDLAINLDTSKIVLVLSAEAATYLKKIELLLGLD